MITKPQAKLWQDHVPLVVDHIYGNTIYGQDWEAFRRFAPRADMLIDACRLSVEALGIRWQAGCYSCGVSNYVKLISGNDVIHVAGFIDDDLPLKAAWIAAVDWLVKHRRDEAEKGDVIEVVRRCHPVGSAPAYIIQATIPLKDGDKLVRRGGD